MSDKVLSTFEREMQDLNFREDFEKGYKAFALSDLLIGMMKESRKTVRGLSKEVGISPTIIQRIRSGEQQDLKISNFMNIIAACGYHLSLEKENKKIAI